MISSLWLSRRSLLAAGLAMSAAATHAQPVWPTRPIRFIISFPPGGAIDTVMRLIGPSMAETLGQPAVLENRPGAAGSIAAGVVAVAPPDGYTFLCDTSTHATAPHLIRNLTFRYETAFTAVTHLTSVPLLVVAHPSLPANTIAELLALARSRAAAGRPLAYASGGNGSASHYAAALFQKLARIEFLHVPFRGGGPAVQALLAGTVDFHIGTAGSSAALVQEGRLKAFAVSTRERLGQFPDLPTLHEAGLPGYEFLEWGAILAPAATPPVVVARVQAAASAALRLPAVQERLDRIGILPVGSPPEESARFIAEQRTLAGELTRSAAITLD
ncbi:Bug family tripartite tricarboxylate transporter substrate binding protein [Elioraea tepidiphila]|jgi:tripartite-type tricarboxylate transporter receptor subunit TctC|uniref:Bug family tripartite tricarboxylate transporter substrate binding protein n=1 Tax=Elioraea tepidiphila TaxID=457934 RepID=UPI0004B2B07F|nr:tripartite tricarboxylate transporter substrate-binding protein [Elioraea tepidiphila]